MAIGQVKEEIPGNPKLISTGSRRLCFFCLKDITPIRIKIEEGTSTPPSPSYSFENGHGHLQFQFALRNISRFLKFTGVERSLSESDGGIVIACEECYKLSEEFTELYKELDMIQLRMNWCMRRICEIMGEAEVEEKGKTGGVIDSEAGDFASLRRKTIMHGRKKIRESYLPVVSLKRTKAPETEQGLNNDDVVSPPLPLPPPELKKDIETVTTTDEGNNVHDPVGGDNPERGGPPHSPPESASESEGQPSLPPMTLSGQGQSSPLMQLQVEHESTSLPPTPSTSPPSPIIKTDDHLSCPFCRAIFRVKHLSLHIQQACLSGHILQFHCDHYFPTQRLEWISPLQYNRILVDLLFKEFCVEKTTTGQYNCPFCSSSFKPAASKNLSACLLRLKLHLLNEHKPKLERKLYLIQRDPQLLEKLRACNSAGINCECGCYLQNALIHQAHRLYHCTMTPFPQEMNSTSTREEIENHEVEVRGGDSGPAPAETPCPVPAAKRMRFSSEVEPPPPYQSTVESNPPRLQEQVLPRQQHDNVVNLTQPSLSEPPNSDHWTSWINSFHAKQNNPSMNRDHLPATGAAFPIPTDPNPSSTSTFPSYYAKPPSSSTTSSAIQRSDHHHRSRGIACPYCRAVFFSHSSNDSSTQQSRLIGHLFQYHCEHYFPTQKLSTTTYLQYKQILVDLLFRDFISEGMNHSNCSTCSSLLSSRTVKDRDIYLGHFKLHLVTQHRGQLEDRLWRIQQDPRLEETLRASNPLRSFCECGVYLADIDEHKMHEMFHCTVKVPNNAQQHCLKDKRSEGVKEKLARIVQNIQNRNLPTDKSPPEPYTGAQAQAANRMNAQFPEQPLNTFPVQMISIKEKGTTSDSNDPMNTSCLYCNVKHSSRTRTNGFEGLGLTMHMMIYHMEHFFPNERKEGLVTEWQFKRIVADLLFTDFVQKDDQNCRLCGKLYATRTGLESMRFLVLKYHLVVNHYDSLKGKLDSIQNDPNLAERLANGNPHGVECPCGTYLSTKMCLEQHKRHCKLNVSVSIPPSVKTTTVVPTVQVQNHPRMHNSRDNNPPAFQNASVSIMESKETRTVEPEPEQWTCDKCGHLYFFKEMLEEHKKNECMAYAFSNYVADMLDGTPQDRAASGGMDVNKNKNSTWNFGNDTAYYDFGSSSEINSVNSAATTTMHPPA